MSEVTIKYSAFSKEGTFLGFPRKIEASEINFMTTVPIDPFEQSSQFIWRLGDSNGFSSPSIVPVRLCTNHLNVVVCMNPSQLDKAFDVLSQEDSFRTIRATEDRHVGSKQIGVVNTKRIAATSAERRANISFNVSRPVKDSHAPKSIVASDSEGTRLFVSEIDLPTYESLRPKLSDPYAVHDSLGLGPR